MSDPNKIMVHDIIPTGQQSEDCWRYTLIITGNPIPEKKIKLLYDAIEDFLNNKNK